jgi:hypothetical protein
MVKNTKEDQELIEENEKLEQLFRGRIINKRKHRENQIQFKNKLIELILIMASNVEKNKNLEKAFFEKSPDMINKICLGAKFDFLNREKILKCILNLIRNCKEESLLKNQTSLELLIKNIFNIMIYKKSKNNINLLLEIIFDLLKRKNVVIQKMINKNLYVLMTFLKKGKDIDKIYFGFIRIISSSAFIFKEKYEELILLLKTLKNKFFLNFFLKYLSKAITRRNITQISEQKMNGNQSFESTADFFTKILENNINEIFENLEKNEIIVQKEETKKQKKTKKYLLTILNEIEQFTTLKIKNIKLVIQKLQNN